MRHVWYQGREYVVFDFPENPLKTVLLYPSTIPDAPQHGYRFVKRNYVRRIRYPSLGT